MNEYPDDMPEEVRHHIDHQKMMVQAHAHQVHGFLDELTEEQLKTFKGIMHNYSDRSTAAFLVGTVSTMLTYKFGCCPACGEKHDEELHKMANPENPEDAEVRVAVVDFHGKSLSDFTLEDCLRLLDTNFEGSIAEPMDSSHWADFVRYAGRMEALNTTMDEYGMNFVTFCWPMVQCANCGINSPSLKDRMLQPAGIKGCSGCQQKAKFG